MVNLSQRPVGKSTVSYGGYSGYVRAQITNHNLGHEETPRYEIFVRMERSDAVCDHVEANVEKGVWYTEKPSLVGLFRGESSEEKRRSLTKLVAEALGKAFDRIEEIESSAGMACERPNVHEIAREAVASWDYQEPGVEA